MAFNPTFPDDWLPGSGEEVEGMPYFILNPFAGESEEPIVKTREHRLVNGIRKKIYRETSADLVKTADGGNVEEKLANVSSPFLELGDLTDYINDGTDTVITDTALIAKLNTALNAGFVSCKIIFDGDEFLFPIQTTKYAEGSFDIYGYGGSQSPFVLNLFEFDGDDWTIYPNNINSIISI